ncbi:Fanconi anemia group J protein isoform X2 [Selaginella moellendorffii]|uniref:Fanconi anemia group J protein isoform X2 n=1 Tax=Selaginella moellendorffii TaxID=88036 RepID=UPI000D1C2628|nr:Fanconi anemia group J protein isoform X2 [Selaginella moellendorffii]|eukprot:XP_024528457.1 Fanconi anemia group J protein isoform X2 [Selaginella moellendorffii]
MEAQQYVYQICGVKVEFPYRAYGSQLAFMGKVITTLERAFRDPDGHCNALLESPTGSGKSLSLLCAALAWQQHRMVAAASIGPATQFGGGFIPEGPASGAEDKHQAKKNKPPTIFFATRTHSQISQIVHELKKTNYRVPMAILAARKHYCTNQHVCKKANLDDECKVLLKDPHKACPQFKNVNKLKHHPALRKGGCHETHDIEDLVTLARSVRGCAYFTSRIMAADAQIVFCPYSYILSPIFRKAMDVDIRGAIIIFDEAHNIEDMSREAGSVDLDTSILEELRNELEELSSSEDSHDLYRPLFDMVQELLIWIRQQDENLQRKEVDHYYSNWTGPKGLEQLQAAGISSESFSIQLDCAVKAAGAASDPDPEKPHLSGRCASAMEGLFCALKFMLSKPEYIHDYQIVVQRVLNKVEGTDEWLHKLSFWCLNPGVVFNEIATICKSVVLTSGTLSPMGSFASELGTSFEMVMEAPHIIDLNSQLLVSAVSFGPGNVPLNASYQYANTVAFQDALGTALEQICNIVPDGALVFFPSYKLLQRVCNRWKTTGQWKRILDIKSVFVEPQGSTGKFEDILKDFYKVIKGENVEPSRRKRILTPKNFTSAGGQTGAAFLAVCRGKVSEGINFSDENARIVVVVGIPFPNLNDVQVAMKKNYNDNQKTLKSLLGGDQWYCYQAFRALNQAVGRCIRHRGDYGAIVLLDERFNKANYTGYMSKWLRKSIMRPASFQEALRDLQAFFSKFENTGSTKKCSSVISSITTTPLPGGGVKSCSLLEDQSTDGFVLKTSSLVRERQPELEDVIKLSSCCGPWFDSNAYPSANLSTPRITSLNNVSQVPETANFSSPVQVPVLTDNLMTMATRFDTSKDVKNLCCRKCGHHLSAYDNPRATYQLETLEKKYLASLAMTATPLLRVIIMEAQHLHSYLNDNPGGQAFRERNACSSGVWIEEDGCVFKPIVCGWCTDLDVCLGAHILAADPANMKYAGKVVLFLDSIETSDCSPKQVEQTQFSVDTPVLKRPLVTSLTATGKRKLRTTS